MKIIWFTWKDIEHPDAGGAEVVAKELGKRLIRDGHELVFITSRPKGTKASATLNGYKVIRVGSRLTVYWEAFRYYRKNLKDWPDLVIDEMNTIPFFAKFYTRGRHILLVHMLCRKIWFYELPLPFSLIGYMIEPLYIRLVADQKVITVSESTKQDLLRYGYKEENIDIISEGLETTPLAKLDKIPKYETPTLLSLGAMRTMKQTLEQVRSFEKAKSNIPDLRLIMAGDNSSRYGQKVLAAIAKSPYRKDIRILGRVSQNKKLELMQQCHIILVTSVKEGWGLIVTEAASQGTPAIVYDVDGLRDSVRDGKTGLIAAHNTPEDMAVKIIALLRNPNQYNRLRHNAWQWSKQFTFDRSYEGLKEDMYDK